MVRHKNKYVSRAFQKKEDARAQTFGDLIDLHIADMKEVGKPPGRSKDATLAMLKRELGAQDRQGQREIKPSPCIGRVRRQQFRSLSAGHRGEASRRLDHWSACEAQFQLDGGYSSKLGFAVQGSPSASSNGLRCASKRRHRPTELL